MDFSANLRSLCGKVAIFFLILFNCCMWLSKALNLQDCFFGHGLVVYLIWGICGFPVYSSVHQLQMVDQN